MLPERSRALGKLPVFVGGQYVVVEMSKCSHGYKPSQTELWQILSSTSSLLISFE
jgi:hypothetical protein